MSVTVTCGQCGRRFTVAPHLYGQRVRCTACQGILNIPSSPDQKSVGLSSSLVPNLGVPGASQRSHSSARTSSPLHAQKRLILVCSGIVKERKKEKDRHYLLTGGFRRLRLLAATRMVFGRIGNDGGTKSIGGRECNSLLSLYFSLRQAGVSVWRWLRTP